MTYEHGLTRTEELFYRHAHGLVPVPEVVHADHRESGGVVPMTLRPGRIWHEVGERISPGGRARLRAELGRHVAVLHRITGLVDGERAFWGDPLAEMVSLSLLGDVESDPDLLRGYREAGGVFESNARTRTRLALYRTYLYLIMLVEGVPLGYSGSEHERRSARVGEELFAALDTLTGECPP